MAPPPPPHSQGNAHWDEVCVVAEHPEIRLVFQWNPFGEMSAASLVSGSRPDASTVEGLPLTPGFARWHDHSKSNKMLNGEAKIIVIGTGLWAVKMPIETVDGNKRNELPSAIKSDPLVEIRSFVNGHKKRAGTGKPLVILRSPVSVGDDGSGTTNFQANSKMLDITHEMQRLAKQSPDPKLKFVDAFTPMFDAASGYRSRCDITSDRASEGCRCHFEDYTGWMYLAQQLINQL